MKAISMQKPKTKRTAPDLSLVARMRESLSAIEIEGGAEIYPLLDTRLRQRAKAAPAGSALRRRLVAMRVALLGGAELRLSNPEPLPAPQPEPEVKAPPPPPEPPKGVVNSVTLEDAAKMLFAAMGADEDIPAAATAPLKVDFSMFGDEDETATPAPEAQAEDFDPFAEMDAAPVVPPVAPDVAGVDDAPDPEAAPAFQVDFDPFAALALLPDAKSGPLVVDFDGWDDEPDAEKSA